MPEYRGSLSLDLSSLEALLRSLSQTPTDRTNHLTKDLASNNVLLSSLRNKNGETILHLAAKDGNIDIFKAVIDGAGSDTWVLISAQNNDKATALHYAAKKERLVDGSDRDLDAQMTAILLNAAGQRASELALIIDHGDNTALQ